MAVFKFDQIPYEKVQEGVVRKIVHTGNLMTVLIDFSGGPWDKPQPFHSHPHEQVSIVFSGEFEFYLEDEEPVLLKAGDMFTIPSGEKHTVRLVSNTARLIDNFTPLREDFMK